MKNKKVVLSKTYEKAFARLPKEIREAAYEKIAFFLKDPSHPSLRVKKIKGTSYVWEMSVTMNYRITLQIGEDEVILRTTGTHDILRTR
ncbi:MAG: hypothetical protein AUJ71_01095 [Candidatus Omnitrophica bacterium CG1_02_49_16]|nr:MAG: hypothetical protein AUJ71_01095 [Candidatus Omnitrophica bacterium CG1_02_49_16]